MAHNVEYNREDEYAAAAYYQEGSSEPSHTTSGAEYVSHSEASEIGEKMKEPGYPHTTVRDVGKPLSALKWSYVSASFGAKLYHPREYSDCEESDATINAANCIAWALERSGRVQCPKSRKKFIELFEQHGYELCDYYEATVDGYMKDGIMEHASRKLTKDTWSSMLGYEVNLLLGHSREALSNELCDYGKIEVFMRKAEVELSGTAGTTSTTGTTTTSSVPSSTSTISSSMSSSTISPSASSKEGAAGGK